jgi:Bifunctional DNA primase/polymerase, N-terminal
MTRPEPDLLRAALAMAARGWHVFPCAPNGKEPALRGNWQEHATTDPRQIRDWWANRAYNIGVSCGPSGLVVIDLDMPKAPNQPGQLSGPESFCRLCQGHGQALPCTLAVETPSGGRHLYFAARDGGIRNSAGRLAPMVDVRAAGGYVIGPGSRIGDCGYTQRNSASPALLPGWLASLMSTPPPPPVPPPRAAPGHGQTAYAMAALRNEAQRMAAATDGTRHDTLNRAAYSLGRLVGAGLLPERAVITALADAAAQSGLTRQREIHRIICSGLTAGIRRPRAIPAPQPGRPNSPARLQPPRDGPALPARTATPRLAP